jgi:bacterioferritin-associated ferredoxin
MQSQYHPAETAFDGIPPMDCDRSPCTDCHAHFICHCLQVTEAAVVDAVVTLGLRTVRDIRRQTGAGEGCTCCHDRLRQVLEQVHCETAVCG